MSAAVEEAEEVRGEAPAAVGSPRFLVVRLGSMGDVIHTLPAVATVRAALPQAHIGWAIEERWSELLCAAGFLRSGPRGPERPLVDAIHATNTRAWRSALLSDETWREVRGTVGEMRAHRYDAAVDFQGAWKSAVLARLARADMLVGSNHPWETPASMFYSRRVEPAGKHVVEQNLSLALSLVPEATPVLDFPLPRDPAAEDFCRRELKQLRVEDFALLNPGAGWGAKCWPAQRYGEVARMLAQQGLSSLLNYGPGEEALAREVEAAGGGAAHPIRCSLGELIALTRRARLFVGGDTGPTHLAAALGIPVIAIYGPTNPARNGPYGAGPIEVLRSETSVTSHARRAQPEPGLLSIGVQEVLAAAQRLLRGSAA